jgi:hypothetical protein
MTRHAAAAAFVLFAGLAILHTWPLITDPDHLSRNDNADTMLNEWTVAWIAHQVPRDPLHLFDANIFYPERLTLAYSEHMIVPALMVAPISWLGGSPVLAYNVALLLGMTLSGWAMCFVVRRWTGDWYAGIVAGSLMAFNAHTMGRLGHLQAQHVEFLPFALMALDRLLVDRRTRTALVLALCFVLQALSSNYLLVFTIVALACAVLVRSSEWGGSAWRILLARLTLSGVVAAVAVGPFLVPYAIVSREQGLVRPLAEVARYSATWGDYLLTASRAHFALWSHHFASYGTTLFPGVMGLTLTGAAIATGAAFADRRARMASAFGIAGVLLSLGPALPGYAVLYRLFPLMQGIRSSARFGYLALVAVAVLAGFGLAALRARLSVRAGVLCSLGVLAIVSVETLRAPIRYTLAADIPAMYARLADRPDSVVVEIPMADPRAFHLNAAYLLNSTRNWRPLVNGYSGFQPASYRQHYQDFNGFPDDRAIAALRAAGVTHVVVHTAAFASERGENAMASLTAARGLAQVYGAPGLRVFEVRPTDTPPR